MGTYVGITRWRSRQLVVSDTEAAMVKKQIKATPERVDKLNKTCLKFIIGYLGVKKYYNRFSSPSNK